jgi:hypothetical protein
VTLRVPATIPRTPKLGGSNWGVQSLPKRNSSTGTISKKPIVGTISERTIAVVVRTERIAQRAKAQRIARSP